ncbi:MAG: hypothetical protein HYY50_02200 [Candidatus Kerfeldbacteria bacterium]|nr:hypothetical protein [Candidatus Kerfeldbacteria bacterium]
MSTFARFMMVAALALSAAMATGCTENIIGPQPIDRYYNGAVFNVSQYNLRIRIVNPPEKFSRGDDSDHNYTILRDFDAERGVQSYWLQQKAPREEPYHFEIYGREGRLVARFDVAPNGKNNDSPYEGGLSGLDWWYEWPTNRRMYIATPSGGDDR